MTLIKVTRYTLECDTCGDRFEFTDHYKNPRVEACTNGWRNGAKVLTSLEHSQSSIDICEECRKEGVYVNKDNVIMESSMRKGSYESRTV